MRITEEEILEGTKTRLMIIGDYHDAVLSALILDTQNYLKSAGVKYVDDESCIGLIARGVADLWNMGSGQGMFSKAFYERTIQLVLEQSGIEIK